MYEELVQLLKDKAARFDYDGWVDTAVVMEKAADAIEKLKKENEQLTKKLVRPRPPKRKACSCGKKKWKQWYHTDTGMWSLQCDNCGKSSRQVKYQSQLNAAWNEIADSEIDPPKEES